MSIAAISSHFASAVLKSAASTPSVEPSAPVRAPSRESGRRHELVLAMNQALGVESASDDKATEQAVFRFAHALMQDLRTMAGEASEGPRAWGRRDWGDLSQRLSALSTAASAPAEPAESETLAIVAPAPAPAVERPAAPAPSAEVADAPNPLTTATAAVHIMKVPSSHLLEAFVSLQRALGRQSEANQSDPRAGLAELAKKLAAALASTPAKAVPAGSVVDLKA